MTWLACFLAQVLGLIAATPAVGLAFLAQRVLENYTDIIKRLSGWGLFVFAMIFLIKGFKLRAAAKAAPVTARAAETPAADPGDVSIEVTGSPKGGGGFTVGSQEERAKGEVEGLTGGAASPAVSASYLSPQCNRLRCACAAPPFPACLPGRVLTERGSILHLAADGASSGSPAVPYVADDCAGHSLRIISSPKTWPGIYPSSIDHHFRAVCPPMLLINLI